MEKLSFCVVVASANAIGIAKYKTDANVLSLILTLHFLAIEYTITAFVA